MSFPSDANRPLPSLALAGILILLPSGLISVFLSPPLLRSASACLDFWSQLENAPPLPVLLFEGDAGSASKSTLLSEMRRCACFIVALVTAADRRLCCVRYTATSATPTAPITEPTDTTATEVPDMEAEEEEEEGMLFPPHSCCSSCETVPQQDKVAHAHTHAP